jgi:hypothetical protein
MIELWTLRDGLSLVFSLGFSSVLIELDALVVFLFPTISSSVYPSLSTLVDDCKFLLRMIPQMGVKHVFRETKKMYSIFECISYFMT